MLSFVEVSDIFYFPIHITTRSTICKAPLLLTAESLQ